MTEATLAAIKIFLPAIIAFSIGLAFAPAWIDTLRQKKMWKKRVKNRGIDGARAEIFQELHHKNETSTPRMGGVVIWVSVLVTTFIFWIMAIVLPENELLSRLDYLSRSQTWLPLFAMLVGATVGLIDDYIEVDEKYLGIDGLSLRKRLLVVTLLGLAAGWWFYNRLEVDSLFIPFLGDIFIGPLIIILFILVMVGTYAGGIIDGIDGLSGGVFAAVFSSYGIIAYTQDQFDIAALCFVIVGATLAFLWFNLPPARYYMTETGSMALTVTLAVIAFLTDQVALLPIIAMPLAITPLSNIIQIIYKKIYKRKLFKITPIHHHFEAIGWPAPQVTMKYWIVSIICALSGTVLALIG